MLNLEDTIRAFRCCTQTPPDCANCPEQGPGFGFECKNDVKASVTRWLNAHLPHVLAPEELPEWDGTFLIEVRGEGAMDWVSWYAEYELYDEAVFRMVDRGGGVNDRFKKLYGYEWRCWTSRPSDAQRAVEPWEG